MSNIAFVLMSHGPRGAYAYLPSGTQITITSTNTSEQNNGKNLPPSAAPNAFYQGQLSSSFQDILYFSTKEAVNSYGIDPANKVVSSTTCSNNSTYINQDLNSTNAGTVRSNITQTEKLGVSGAYYNVGDQAAFEVMWMLQEACYIYYGTSKQCPSGATLTNPAFAGTDYSIAWCVCNKGTWSGSC
jgi:hypothetical protein